MESILVLLKPDAVRRGLCGTILTRFEQRGLQIAAMKLLQVSPAMAEEHYQEHRGREFFSELVAYITSGPLVALVIQGANAVKIVRTMMGYTNPVQAGPGTIRGDFALTVENNIVHGSDCVESASREIKLFFAENEIFDSSSK